jgi:hypothetical protein
MDVSIKSFDVEMDVKNKGIELEISEPNDGKRLGDLIITKSHLIWCEGKTRRENGKKVKWTEFVEIVNAAQKPSKKNPIKKKAAKKTSSESSISAAEPDTE